MPQNLQDALSYSEKWLKIIEKKEVSQEEGKAIIDESKTNFA